MILLDNPIPVTLEAGAEKIQGYVMQLTNIGIMVELEKIPFKIGSFMLATFQMDDGTIITEKVRSIKHYDKFYRTSPKVGSLSAPEAGAAAAPAPVPMRLCELHFSHLSEQSRVALSVFLLRAKTPPIKKSES